MQVASVEKIRKILNEVDPVGIYFGEEINPDEYKSEAGLIFAQTGNSPSVDILADKIRNIFISRFSGVSFKSDDWHKKIAQRILSRKS